MIIAVILMMMMQVSFVDEVHVVAVRDGLVMVAIVMVAIVLAAGVRMPTMMRARMLGRASIRIPRGHCNSMLLDAIAFLMLETALADVVEVSLVSNARVPASSPMSMRFVAWVLRSIVHVRTSARDGEQEPCTRAAGAPHAGLGMLLA